MRIFILAFFLGMGIQQSMGQGPYTNDWIRYELPYFKITVKQEGVYRIGVDQLREAGFPVAATPAEQLSLFYRGEEIAVRVAGVANGKLTDAGYIEFFTQGNIGVQDSLVYRPHSARPPTTFSLYSDESHYFLTIDPQRKGRRLEEIAYQPSNAPLEAFHLERQVKQYQDEWSFNNSNGLVPYLQQSYYEKGESWTGKAIRRDSLAQVNITLLNRVKTAAYPIQFKALVNGRFDVYHSIDFSLEKRRFAKLQFLGFDHLWVKTDIQENELRANDVFTLSMQSEIKDQFEQYSLTRYEIVYPQGFEMGGSNAKYFYLLPNPSNQSVVSVGGLNTTNPPVVYDVTQPLNPRLLEARLVGNRWQIAVSNTSQPRTLFVANAAQRVLSAKSVTLKPYAIGADFVIITHKALESAAQTFAEYRKSAAGGSYQVLIVDIEQLYDQFNYGERGPLSVRHFLNYQLKDGKKDKYLLLLGNGMSFPDKLKEWQDRDFIPTFGYPGSDVLLSAGLAGENINTPAFRTGRLSAATNQQVLAYLNKLKEFEKAPPTLSAKNILHLSGGKSTFEINDLKAVLQGLVPLAQNSYLGGAVQSIVKQTVEPVENVSIAKQVNEGVGLITFMGHASPTVPDLNIGYVSSPASQLSNKGKYPFMYFNGCGVGNVFYQYETLASDWLLTPDKGAIGVLSNSYWSYASISAHYLTALYSAMFGQENMLGKPIGEILQKVSNTIATSKDNAYDIANVHQLILLGDPAVVLFKINKPDFAISDKDIFLQSASLTQPIGQADSLRVGVIMRNVGKTEPASTFNVQIRKTENNGAVSTLMYSIKTPARQDTVLLTFKKTAALKKLEVFLDAGRQISELDEGNNEAQLVLDWSEVEKNTSYPVAIQPDRLNPTMEVTVDGRAIPNEAVVSPTPTILVTLRDENPLMLDTTLIQMYLKSCESCVFQPINANKIGFKLTDSYTLQAQYKSGSPAPGRYELLVLGKDAKGNTVGAPYLISFVIEGESRPFSVIVSPNPTSFYAKFIYTLSEEPTSKGVLKIYSNSGQLVGDLTFTSHLGENEFYWQVTQPPGIYLYRLTVGKETMSGKLVIH